jgi:hypothetical protein
VNEGLDEIYDEAEEETPRYKFVDNEVDSIMRQAFTGKKDYSFDRKFDDREVDDRIRLRFKRYNSVEDDGSPTNSMSTLNLPDEVIILPIGSLDFSLDMLKSELIKNEIVIQALGIKAERHGRITTTLKSNIVFGKVVNQYSRQNEDHPSISHFMPFVDSRMSLKQHGIDSGDLMYVIVEDLVGVSRTGTKQ